MQLDTVSCFFIKAILIHLMKIKSEKRKYSKQNKKQKEGKVLLFQQTVIFCLSEFILNSIRTYTSVVVL